MFRTEERVRKGVFARPRKRVAVPVESVPLAGLRCDSNAVSSIRTRAAVPNFGPKGHITQRHFFGADDGVVDKAEKPGRRLADPDKRKSEVRLSFDPNGSAPSGSEACFAGARTLCEAPHDERGGHDRLWPRLDCWSGARPSAATAAAAKPAHTTVAPTPEETRRDLSCRKSLQQSRRPPSPRPPLPWPVPAGTDVRDRQRREQLVARSRNVSYATDADHPRRASATETAPEGSHSDGEANRGRTRSCARSTRARFSPRSSETSTTPYRKHFVTRTSTTTASSTTTKCAPYSRNSIFDFQTTNIAR